MNYKLTDKHTVANINGHDRWLQKTNNKVTVRFYYSNGATKDVDRTLWVLVPSCDHIAEDMFIRHWTYIKFENEWVPVTESSWNVWTQAV